MTPKTQDAPEQTGQHNGNGKPFVLGTLNAEELQEYVTDWIEGGLDWGADAAGALKHHCEMLVAQGPDAGFGAAHLGCVQSCLIEVTLSGDSTDKLFGPLAAEVIFPHVDWQRACSDALKRGPARLAAYRGEPDARAAAKAQGEVESTDEIADSAVSETPPSRGVPTLYAIRRKSDGEFHANDINDEPKIMQVHCFASFDEAAAARLLFSKPEDEIVPLIERTAATGQPANENAWLTQEFADLKRHLDELFMPRRQRTTEDDEPAQTDDEIVRDNIVKVMASRCQVDKIRDLIETMAPKNLEQLPSPQRDLWLNASTELDDASLSLSAIGEKLCEQHEAIGAKGGAE